MDFSCYQMSKVKTLHLRSGGRKKNCLFILLSLRLCQDSKRCCLILLFSILVTIVRNFFNCFYVLSSIHCCLCPDNKHCSILQLLVAFLTTTKKAVRVFAGLLLCWPEALSQIVYHGSVCIRMTFVFILGRCWDRMTSSSPF